MLHLHLAPVSHYATNGIVTYRCIKDRSSCCGRIHLFLNGEWSDRAHQIINKTVPIFFYSIRTRVCNLSHRPLVVVIKNAGLRPFCVNLTSDLKATSIIYIIIQIQIKEVHLENISSNKNPKCKSQHALKFNAINFDTTITLL